MNTIEHPPRLVTRLMTAQILVIAVGALSMIAAAMLAAPALFRYHLAQSGESDPMVTQHAEQAFTTSFALALALATVSSLIAAGVVSWFIVTRVAHPVEELADAAETLASGSFEVDVPGAAFSSELARLAQSFEDMARRLADTQTTRRQLLSDLAHELRTPLATLEAYVDGLEDDVLPAEPATFSTMRDEVGRLRRLAADLREAALAEEHALSIDLRPEDAAEIVRTAVAAHTPTHEHAGLSLTCIGADQPIRVLADAVRLQQVLANLLDNARRHARSQVVVTVSSGMGTAVVTVDDDGAGIPADQREAVFHRFHRVDVARRNEDGSGSGLGLTIARAIIEEHGGTLTATTSPTGGARLTATLPTDG